MWEKIETFHWTILVAVISVLSVLLFQQQVLAQWTSPDEVPGGTNLDNLVVTPMQEDLNLGGFKINDPATDATFVIDPSAAVDIEAAKADFDELCIAGACNVEWPSGAGGGYWTQAGSDLYYSSGNVGIGTGSPDRLLVVEAPGSDPGSYPTDAARVRITANGSGKQAPGLEFYNVERDAGKVAKIVSRDEYIFSFESENKDTDEDNASYEQLMTLDKSSVGTELRIQNKDSESSAQIVFEEGLEPDNFAIRYNGSSNVAPLNNGYNNWLEFWGQDALQGNAPADPIMIMERDYDTSSAPTPTYQGVGIGVPARTHIDAKLRVQNYGTEDILQLYDGSTKVVTVEDGGNVGIGTDNPGSSLEIRGAGSDESNLRFRNDGGDMKIIFQEYDAPPTPYGDISIRYNGNNPDIYNGYSNWLEFWGRSPSQGATSGEASLQGGRPIMTMQRDYEPSKDSYRGVGIGVPTRQNITARLRVQNFGDEDILQLYDDEELSFQVSNGGYVGVNGPVHTGVPVFINGTGNNGLKLYSYGLYSYNNSSLELKATNDVYLNPGLYDGVGIEVSNPQQILHVKNPNSFADTLFRLENDNDGATFSNQTTQVEFARGPNWTTDYSWVGPTSDSTFDVWTMENVPMLFGTNGSERMRINSTDVTLSNYLNLAKVSSAPAGTDCDSDAEMGRVKVDNINSVLYICTGDPGGGIPGSWKSLSL